MRYALLTLLVAFTLLGGYLYVYLGAYRSPEIKGIVDREFSFLYMEHVGPYHEIGKTLQEVESWARENRVACPMTFGRFLDDPNEVEPVRLRSQVGCLVQDGYNPSTDSAIRFEHLPSTKYLLVHFAGAPSIGPFKVYPTADDWLNENKYKLSGPVIEVYSSPHGPDTLETDYYFPLSPLVSAQ